MIEVQVNFVIYFFSLGASAGDCNDPGDSEQEGGRGMEVGRGRLGGGNREGETGMGKEGGVEVQARAGSEEGETGRVRQGGGNGEGERAMGRGEMGRGNRKGQMGKGAKGRGRRWGKRRGDFTDGYDEMLGGHMECLGGKKLQFFLTLFTHATPGTPASLSILIKQVIVYLFIYFQPFHIQPLT